jgi:hypothetical protein
MEFLQPAPGAFVLLADSLEEVSGEVGVGEC